MDTHKAKQYPFRCDDEDLICHVDIVAKELGVNRNDYILRSLKNQLAEDLRPYRPKNKVYEHNFTIDEMPLDVEDFINCSKIIEK
jgi:hypothetical protein